MYIVMWLINLVGVWVNMIVECFGEVVLMELIYLNMWVIELLLLFIMYNFGVYGGGVYVC